MTYLELARRLRKEAGGSGTDSSPASVDSQTGEMLQLVNWINTAYEDVQNEHATWRFLRSDFSFTTTADTQEYDPTDSGVITDTDLASWVKDDIRVYESVSDENYLNYIPWDEFRESYMFGSSRESTGKPIIVSVKPDNNLILWPIPDDEYTVNGEYYKTADVLSGDSDTSIIPTRFQMVIVWRALMYYGAYNAANEKYVHGENQYKRLISKMELDQLEDFTYGDPLA